MGAGCICTKKSSSNSTHNTMPSPILLQQVSAEDQQKHKVWSLNLKGFEYFKNPLSHFYTQHPGRLKKLILEGPPSDMRWEVWKTLFQYQDIEIPSDQIHSEFQTLIEKDLDRTFPGHPFFSTAFHLECLKEVLVNIVRLNPDLGYCQGMNSVAGIFLLVSSNSVKEASLMLHIFIQKYGGKGLFENGFPKVLELLEMFNKSFRTRMPGLCNHFQKIELDEQLWISKWFMTLFSYSFKLSAVIRFWDVIFVNGLNAMVSISIAILQKIKKDLETKDLSITLDYFSTLRTMDLNFDEIIKVTLRTQSTIESRESFRNNKDTEENHLKIHIHWEHSPEPQYALSPRNLDLDGRRRANSLVIQQSSRSLYSP